MSRIIDELEQSPRGPYTGSMGYLNRDGDLDLLVATTVVEVGVDVPNAVWHQSHTFTCFPYPTFTEEDCRQIGAALAKVIKAYSK